MTLACSFPIVLLFALISAPLFAGGIAIVETTLSDNGDDDGFGDTRETVTMTFTVKNTTTDNLTGVTARLTSETAHLACLTVPTIDIGDLAPGETRQVDPVVFTVADVDRILQGKGPLDPLAATFDIEIVSGGVKAHPSTLSFDLDIDVSGGSGPTTFFESFEETLGQFEVMNLDQGKHGLANSDGYRCQYSDPDWVNSNTYNVPPFNTDCHLGNSSQHADAEFWGLSGPGFSPQGGRGFSGVHSLFFGVDLGLPKNWTSPVTMLEAAGTSDPIHLAWNGVAPELSFMHMVSLVDSRAANLPEGLSYDRGVVMAQVADDQGDGVGPWYKIEAHQNGYDQQNSPNIFNCSFDPVDDGNTEDDFYFPNDPNRKFGPSSTCYPEFTYLFIGETSEPFDPQNTGLSDGPAQLGMWGIGSWIESKFDLSRFRGRSVRVRFLASQIQAGADPAETWEDVFLFNPEPGDDGWWVDDVTISGALSTPAVATVDTNDNSSLPQLPDGDADSVPDACDNCVAISNFEQYDFDGDGTGDDCDECPQHADTQDIDSDGFCGDADNCEFDFNPAQIDSDDDGFGVPCDCNDASDTTFPGAVEINDGQDNDCDGVADEIPDDSGFLTPGDKTRYSWTAQSGALTYQVARADSADFTSGCIAYPNTNQTFIIDTDVPAADAAFYYLVRPKFPNPGSWGQNSDPTERTVPCS